MLLLVLMLVSDAAAVVAKTRVDWTAAIPFVRAGCVL